MKILRTSHNLRSFLISQKKKGLSIGFVPTMGCLHEGHLSLIRLAKKENEIVVASIFVNPLQFGPKEDYSRYPRDLAGDRRSLEKVGTDILFLPDAKEFYPKDFQTSVTVGRLSRPLCGKTRPTHFAGVCTVVLKLLNTVMPDVMYLGQKDYQQFCVVRQMAKDLSFPVQVKMAPTLREGDGLAMSSRNVFLSPEERRQAPLLYLSLKETKKLIEAGRRDTQVIRRGILGAIKKASLAKMDYVEIVDARTLGPVVQLREGSEVLIALAVYFGKTRLIDNILIKVK